MRKSLLTAIMAASALIPAAAMAQDNNDRPQREGQPHAEGRPNGQRAQPAAQPQRPAAPAQAPQAARVPEVRAGAQVQAQPQARPDRGGRPDFRGQQGQPQGQVQQSRGPGDGRYGRPDVNGGPQRGGDPRANDGPQRGDPRVNGGYRPDARGYDGRGHDGRGYNNGSGYNGNAGRGWSRDWRGDNRYNYNVYRNQNRSAYHLPRYYAPSGWGYGYRRFSVGYELNSILFGQNYWIGDPAYYRLPPAYGPYRWVRYYNDALLVDIRTGSVVDTVYDIFW